jgi:hypothetical protein
LPGESLYAKALAIACSYTQLPRNPTRQPPNTRRPCSGLRVHWFIGGTGAG